jgi:hypothetical protein
MSEWHQGPVDDWPKEKPRGTKMSRPLGAALTMQVTDMIRRGKTREEIAAYLDVSENAVSCARQYAIRRGIAVPRFPRNPAKTYKVKLDSRAVRTALSAEAAKRGLSPSRLMNRIVTHVISDNIIDAVMDDT